METDGKPLANQWQAHGQNGTMMTYEQKSMTHYPPTPADARGSAPGNKTGGKGRQNSLQQQEQKAAYYYYYWELIFSELF